MSDVAFADDAVQQLHGNLYRIYYDKIKFPDNSINLEKENLHFFNPRLTLKSGKNVAKGFSKPEMDELRKSIQSEGLLHPLLVVKNDDGTFTLVSGERRKRSIDKLIKDEEVVYDPHQKAEVSAKDAYRWIECRVLENVDDKELFKYAFSENERSTDIGEAETVALVRYWRHCGLSDSEILEMTSKSITWLKETDQIATLPEIIFNSFIKNEINRSAALQLAKVKETEDQLARFYVAKKFAAERLESLKTKQKAKVEKLADDAEVAEAAVKLADKMNLKNDQQKEKKKAQLAKKAEKAAKKVMEAEDELEDLDSVTINTKDINKASGKTKPLTLNKLEKCWLNSLQDIIENNYIGEDSFEYNENLINFTVQLVREIKAGNKDILGILKEHQ